MCHYYFCIADIKTSLKQFINLKINAKVCMYSIQYVSINIINASEVFEFSTPMENGFNKPCVLAHYAAQMYHHRLGHRLYSIMSIPK